MKNFVFISDFDGTLTEKDFFKIIKDEYLVDESSELYKYLRDNKTIDAQYLSKVFNNIGRNEKEIAQDIMKISMDPFAKEFVENIKAHGGDFVIISAGTSYYIDMLLEKHNIKDIDVYSNKGVYKDKGIHFDLDKNSEFYSEAYGINKALVVKKLRSDYKTIYYAGDSAPDLAPALLADVVFAKETLIPLLEKENKKFIEFHNFSEVWDKLKNILD